MATPTQQTLLGWNLTPQSDTFNALGRVTLRAASIGAGVANTTIQDQLLLPVLYKIRKVGVSFTATDDVSGLNTFNLVVGSGSYDTGGVSASQTYTVGGTYTTSDTLTATINSHAVTYTVVGGDTTNTLIATHMAAAINAASSVNTTVYAESSAAVITVYALAQGTAGNSITTTASKSSTSGTFVAGAATMAGGVNTVLGTLAPNDNSFSSGTAAPASGTTTGAGLSVTSSGVGYPTNVAGTGTPIFAQDIPLSTAYPAGAYQATGSQVLTYAPGWISCTTTGGYGIFVPPNYDAVYPMLLPLTLRAITAATLGSISNLAVVIECEPITPLANPGSLNFVQPGIDY